MSNKRVKLTIDEQEYQINVLPGGAGDHAIDIRNLRRDTGYTAYDPGFVNTASCRSGITFLDGEKGILQHRGLKIWWNTVLLFRWLICWCMDAYRHPKSVRPSVHCSTVIP